MYYELAPATNSFHRKLMECLACCFNDVPELAKDNELAAKSRNGDGAACCG